MTTFTEFYESYIAEKADNDAFQRNASGALQHASLASMRAPGGKAHTLDMEDALAYHHGALAYHDSKNQDHKESLRYNHQELRDAATLKRHHKELDEIGKKHPWILH